MSLQAAPSVINLSGHIWFLVSIFQFCIFLQFNSKNVFSLCWEKGYLFSRKKSVIAVLQSLAMHRFLLLWLGCLERERVMQDASWPCQSKYVLISLLYLCFSLGFMTAVPQKSGELILRFFSIFFPMITGQFSWKRDCYSKTIMSQNKIWQSRIFLKYF